MLIALIKRLFAPTPADLAQVGSEEHSHAPADVERRCAELMHEAKRCFEAKDYVHSRTLCDELVELNPANPYAWLQLARALNKQKEHAAAKNALDTAMHLAPDLASAHYERGIALERLRQFSLALKDFERVLELQPDAAPALIYQGRMHYELGDFAKALDCTERALAIEPDNRFGHQHLGLRLRDLGRLQEAERAFKRVIELRPDDAESMCYLALVLMELGHFDEARCWIDQVLAADPVHNEAHWDLALMLLLHGDFRNGWPHYESRRLRDDALARPYRFPEWNGKPMPQDTLLIYAEQGLGDEILFSSCFAQAMKCVGHAVIECDARLEKLFTRSFPGATVHGSKREVNPAWLERTGTISFQIAAGSLPRLMRNEMSDFPDHAGYLKADRARIAYWRCRLDELGSGLKVGLAWTGGSMKTRRRLRSVVAEDLVPLLKTAPAQFVSLQYVDSSDDLSMLRERHQLPVHHWQEAIDDYDETAALVSALDLVISVQTAVVHLSGALGKTAWVLVPSSPEWRYMLHGTTIPWYPSVRLFRQLRGADWGSVIAGVAAELAHYSSGQAAC